VGLAKERGTDLASEIKQGQQSGKKKLKSPLNGGGGVAVVGGGTSFVVIPGRDVRNRLG